MPSRSGAVHSGIEALLDDRGADVVAARVVAVVDREERPASGHGAADSDRGGISRMVAR